jgi:hypothetical protein
MTHHSHLLSAVTLNLTRRQLLRLLAAGTAVTLVRLPAVRGALAGAGRSITPTPGFLTAQELAILDAATAVIVPSDSTVGAHECGVVDYIQSMLSYMPGSDANCDRYVNAADLTSTIFRLGGEETGCPDGGDADGDGVVGPADLVRAEGALFRARPVIAGGPFSGRQPQPHFPIGTAACRSCHVAAPQTGSAAGAGAAATTIDAYPPDFFSEFLQPSRLRAMSWRIRMLGVDAVPEATKNPLATSLPETDLQTKYRNGLASLESISQSNYGKSFLDLTVDQQSHVLDKADATFRLVLTYHTVEGMLCAPEYGGNRDRLGWQLVGFDGDSQPLGYATYDESLHDYRELDDKKPNSGPNPDADAECQQGFSSPVGAFLSVLVLSTPVQPGRVFSAPYCFEVGA